MKIHVDPARQSGVFTFEHRRSIADHDGGHVTEPDLCAVLGQHRKVADLLDRIAYLARIANIDGKALQPLDRLTDVVATDGGRDDALDIGNVQAIASRRIPVDLHIDVTTAGQALCKRGRDPRHLFQYPLDFLRDAIEFLKIGPRHLYADRTLDAGGQHVDTIADGRHPDIGQPRYLDRAIQLLHQLVGRHSWPPLLARLELDRGLEHFHRRRVGRSFRTPGLA